eukprot:7376534-Prymnesium_polylepis.1
MSAKWLTPLLWRLRMRTSLHAWRLTQPSADLVVIDPRLIPTAVRRTPARRTHTPHTDERPTTHARTVSRM